MKQTRKNINGAFSSKYTFDSILGKHEDLVQAKIIAQKYAMSDSSVLILGPTGSGKELFAHAIHAWGCRKNQPFVCVNCAAIPKELMESELFGYEEGAFTGAQKKGKTGKVALADNGTLFLDEIGDLPILAQAKLLRVLEEKGVERLGGLKLTHINFRLICATNCNLRDMIQKKLFRDDLFYRINPLTITVPPLSKRLVDIPLLVENFLQTMKIKGQYRFSDEAYKMLLQYPWPGNVRELRGVIDHAVTLSENGIIDIEHLPEEIVRFKCFQKSFLYKNIKPLSVEVAAHEKFILERALLLTKGSKSKAAKALGISRTTFYEKSKLYGLK